MDYLNMGTVVVGILLIFGFLNADALIREPGLSDENILDQPDDEPELPGEELARP